MAISHFRGGGGGGLWKGGELSHFFFSKWRHPLDLTTQDHETAMYCYPLPDTQSQDLEDGNSQADTQILSLEDADTQILEDEGWGMLVKESKTDDDLKSMWLK